MTPEDYARARRILMRRDPVLGGLIRQYGVCGLAAAQRADHLTALVRAIVFQQLSTKAASTIYSRLIELMPDGQPEAARLALLSDEQLRTAGISRQKAGYLRDLCARVASGALDLDGLERMDDEDVVRALVEVKGIGRWSAEMFLMFRLHRPDVLPVGDLGIVTAVQKAYRLRKRPTPSRLLSIGETWRPYRSVACWYLWRSLNNAPMTPAGRASNGSRIRPRARER
ncbi:MAG TPA: hypothetical protein VLD67_21675 [Vicinamibacterales bacterium]|nr:hypothetical protein [Vicinamibacterales bacterium]